MPEFLSPGVFIEEVNAGGQTVQAVGTSTAALVGWTQMGPVDQATLVTGPSSYQRIFGDFVRESLMPLSVNAFFTNGGARCYVVRVVPSDAVKADSEITSVVSSEAFMTGTGVSPTTKASFIPATPPLRPGMVTINWQKAGVSISGENPVFSPAENGVLLGPFDATLDYGVTNDLMTLNWEENVSTPVLLENPVFAPPENTGVELGPMAATLAFTPNSAVITLNWERAAAPKTATLTAPATVGGADAAEISSATIAGDTLTITFAAASWPDTDSIRVSYEYDLATAMTATLNPVGNVLGGPDVANLSAATIDGVTGDLSITFAALHPPLTDSITVDYVPRGAIASVTDDGAGNFTDTGIVGTVDYPTGEISITWTGALVIPFNGNAVTIDYEDNLWTLEADNEGAWGNNLKFTLKGNDNYFVYAPPGTANAGTWTKYDVVVSLYDSTNRQWVVKEAYEELDFSDDTDSMFAPDVINDASNFVVITDAGPTGGVPNTFFGTEYMGEVIGTQAGTTTAFTNTLLHVTPSVVKGSVKIKYVRLGVTKSVVADADGNFASGTGTDLDDTKTNSVNYDTGVVTLNFKGASPPDNPSQITADYVESPSTTSVDYTFSGGSDGTIDYDTYFGRTRFTSPALKANKQGMFALDRVDEMMQLVIPDWAGNTTIAGDQIDYAEERRDIFAILSTPKGLTSQKAVDYVRLTLNRLSKYAAIYWPWVKVADPLANNRALTVPPVAHIAGIYARTDLSKNVGKAPGGTVDGALRYLIGLEHNPDKGERDTVYPARINPLINTPQTGMAIWGVRTLAADSAWKYINATRLFIFVEKSVFNSTHQYVFESIGQTLYTQIKAQLDGFLLGLFGTGHFAGSSPSQAFFVQCDAENNPPEVVNAGQVVIDVGIAPNKPAEFIRFRFAQKALS